MRDLELEHSVDALYERSDASFHAFMGKILEQEHVRSQRVLELESSLSAIDGHIAHLRTARAMVQSELELVLNK